MPFPGAREDLSKQTPPYLTLGPASVTLTGLGFGRLLQEWQQCRMCEERSRLSGGTVTSTIGSSSDERAFSAAGRRAARRWLIVGSIMGLFWLSGLVAESRAAGVDPSAGSSAVTDPNAVTSDPTGDTTATDSGGTTDPGSTPAPADTTSPPPADTTTSPPADTTSPPPTDTNTPPPADTASPPPTDTTSPPPTDTAPPPPTDTAPLPVITPVTPPPDVGTTPPPVDPGQMLPPESPGLVGSTDSAVVLQTPLAAYLPGPTAELLDALMGTTQGVIRRSSGGAPADRSGTERPEPSQPPPAPPPVPERPTLPLGMGVGPAGGAFGGGGGGGGFGGSAVGFLAALIAFFAFAQGIGGRLSTSTTPLRAAAPAFRLTRPD